jgi:hypothetical protein
MTHEAGGQGMSEYHDDTLTWSQRQAELLRRVAGGEPPNETPDWENIIEEVLDVGRSEVRAVRSLLFQVLLHRLKVTAWPDARQVEHWQNEALAALVQARDAYRPSMRQHIDIAERYATALRALPPTNDGVPAGIVPQTFLPTLEALLDLPRHRGG